VDNEKITNKLEDTFGIQLDQKIHGGKVERKKEIRDSGQTWLKAQFRA